MKHILYFTLTLIIICSACSKRRGGETSKTFIYGIEYNASGIDEPNLTLIGNYVGSSGDTVSIKKSLVLSDSHKYEVTIKDVPLYVNAYFSGYIISDNANSISAMYYLDVKSEPNNDYKTKISYPVSVKSSNPNELLTEEELKEKTSFVLKEKQ